MNRIHYALIWKEVRQSFVILVTFIVLAFGLVAYTYYMHKRNPMEMTLDDAINILLGSIVALSLGLAYMQACGNRILEAGQNLEAFLFTRPVERFTILKVYYAVSLSGLLLWLICVFLFALLIYGVNLFPQGLSLLEVFITIFLLIIAHALTFAVAVLYPSLVGTAATFISFCIITFIAIMDPQLFLDLIEQFQWLLPLLIILSAIAALTVYIYQRKQVS